jgi:uncharacterized protein
MSDDRPEIVQVVYATSKVQRIVTLERQPGLTAVDAVRRSRLLEEFPEILARPLVIGIFGARVEPDHPLEAGDRVEITRPLERDPRDLRRELLKQGQVMGAAARNTAAD